VERGCHGRRGRPTKGKGGGAAKCGRGKGVGGQEGAKGEKKPPLGFLCGRNETTPQMTLT
jgi:hypothetical protein